MRIYASLFLLSAATLTFEINLTRLFSVSQFYHFAFMIVSIALLGFGASGTFLFVFPQLKRQPVLSSLSWLAMMTGLSILGSYLLVNNLPFDSFSIAWDRRQVYLLILHYLALSLPFFTSGLAVGLLLSIFPGKSHKVYAANLSGSALGCLAALAAPVYVGGEGSVVLSTTLAAAAGLVCLAPVGLSTKVHQPGFTGHENSTTLLKSSDLTGRFWRTIRTSILLLLLIVCTYDLIWRVQGVTIFPRLELNISPYKNLSYARQYPNAETTFSQWNSYSRVDVVQSAGIRSYPGLSFRYTGTLPPQDGLLVDGDDLNPVVRSGQDLSFTGHLPARIAVQLRPAAEVLILEPRGGLDILTALAGGAASVTAVEANPLIVQAAGEIYHHPKVSIVPEQGRSYTRQAVDQFDVAVISLVNSFHPVRSGAYSLAEDYRYTVEAFTDALNALKPDGVLFFTRWLQSPPSESLRAFAIAMTAIESMGGDPSSQIVAFRGYNTISFLVKKSPFTTSEIQQIRTFTEDNAYDLVYMPDILESETNRFSVLPEAEDYLAFEELFHSPDRKSFYQQYPYAVYPPTDDHPFMGHYFKWSQARQVIAEIGKTWQPFGGAGYFVVLALLGLVVLLSGVVIFLPFLVFRRGGFSKSSQLDEAENNHLPLRFPLYFGLIGLAFLLVEIPLIQSFILYLGNPSYAFALVLFTLLLFSGFGSQLSTRLPLGRALLSVAVYLFLLQLTLPFWKDLTLGWSIYLRMPVAFVLLAPLGFFMGMAFPGGIRWMMLRSRAERWIPWIWGINGAASVIAAVLAALLALTFGFGLVLRLGLVCYLAALLIVTAPAPRWTG